MIVFRDFLKPFDTFIGEDVSGIPVSSIWNEWFSDFVLIENPLIMLDPCRFGGTGSRGVAGIPAVDSSAEKSIETIEAAGPWIKVGVMLARP